MSMRARLLSREVVPHVLAFISLIVATLLVDALLHFLGVVWIGRYLGIPGTLLIIGSFAYSLRKRKIIRVGKPASFLRWHERMTWAGSFLVLVHAGIHFNALLGWLAVAAMLVSVGSGIAGKFLLDRSRRRLVAAQVRLREHGLSEVDLEDRLYWDSLTFDVVKAWRVVHFPITLAFAVLAVAHIVAVSLFAGLP